MLARESLQCQQCEIEKLTMPRGQRKFPTRSLYAETNENL
jgi:hypothetical protein